MMSQVFLRHEGGDVPYDVVAAQFDVNDGAFDFSLELECADKDNDDVPPEIMIRLTRMKVDDDGATLYVRAHNDFAKNDYYDYPNAFVYSGFHHTYVTACLAIKSQEESSIVADVRIVTDDVDRYDAKARDHLIFGTCKFSRGKKSNMWGP